MESIEFCWMNFQLKMKMNLRLMRSLFLLLQQSMFVVGVDDDDMRRDDSMLRWNFVLADLDKSRTNAVVCLVSMKMRKRTLMLVM